MYGNFYQSFTFVYVLLICVRFCRFSLFCICIAIYVCTHVHLHRHMYICRSSGTAIRRFRDCACATLLDCFLGMWFSLTCVFHIGNTQGICLLLSLDPINFIWNTSAEILELLLRAFLAFYCGSSRFGIQGKFFEKKPTKNVRIRFASHIAILDFTTYRSANRSGHIHTRTHTRAHTHTHTYIEGTRETDRQIESE